MYILSSSLVELPKRAQVEEVGVFTLASIWINAIIEINKYFIIFMKYKFKCIWDS